MNTSHSSKLLWAIGGLAILWYFVAIVYLAADPRPPANAAGADAGKAGESNATAPDKSAKELAQTDKAAKGKSDGLPSDVKQFMALSVTALAGTLATFVGMVLGKSQATSARDSTAAAEKATGADLSLTIPQLAAAWAYVASLVLAVVIWVWQRNDCDPAIMYLGQSFLGLVGGALTVMLNVSPQKNA